MIPDKYLSEYSYEFADRVVADELEARGVTPPFPLIRSTVTHGYSRGWTVAQAVDAIERQTRYIEAESRNA